MRESIRLGRIAGVAVGINWSLLAIFFLIAISLAAGRFPIVAPDEATEAYVIAGLVTAVLFFGSVLLHEISHAVVAQRNGIEVEGIVLWLFGGVAQMKADADSPGVAFRIAAVGPLVSFVIGVACLSLAFGLDQADAAPLVVDAALWLGIINILLAIFNLFPGAPLDGGRVLRSILWKINGDQHRSQVQAARAGRVVGFIIMGLGVLQFAAIGFGGLWLILIGWFLVMAAQAEESHAQLLGTVGSTRVSEVMSPDPVTVPAETPIDEFLERYVFRHRFSTFPVSSPDGDLIGLATVNRVKQLPADQRWSTRIGELATPLDEVPTAGPDDPLADVIDRFNEGDDGRILVMSGSTLVGILSPADVVRLAEMRDLLGNGNGQGRYRGPART